MKSATKALNPTFARSGFVAGCRILLAALLGVGIFASDAAAWGPHGKITEAALNTLPDAARWKAVLGNDQLKELRTNTVFCRICKAGALTTTTTPTTMC